MDVSFAVATQEEPSLVQEPFKLLLFHVLEGASLQTAFMTKLASEVILNDKKILNMGRECVSECV